jgi:OmpR family response regulator RpaB
MPKTCKTQTVLVIEDEIDIQNFIIRILELEGYYILKAGDGETGLEIIKKNPLDLVVLDMLLPKIDGWGVLHEIKSNQDFAKIPVIILTAIAEPSQRRRALRMGANQYLIKPLSAHILSRAINCFLVKKTAALQIVAV